MSICLFVNFPTLVKKISHPSKVRIKKQNYDVTKKFQDKWVMKFPWAELFTREDGS